jgi:alpha-N-arabinofuranosidase
MGCNSYHPFALTSRYGRGMVLQLLLRSPAGETGAFGDVPVDAVAVASDEGGVTLFAVNRDQATPVALDVDVRSLPSLSAASHVAISGEDPDAVNTLSSPDRMVLKTPGDLELDGGRLQAVLPPLSWNMIRLCCQRPSRVSF